MLWFADPSLIKIVMKNDKPVGFLLAYPDISAALQKTKGRLFPCGWLTMLRALRTTDWININGAGMIEEYRGLGGTAILFSELFKSEISKACALCAGRPTGRGRRSESHWPARSG